MSKVEKVARAIWADYWDGDPLPWDEIDENARATSMSMARAAIKAMREPTQAMGVAAMQEVSEQECDIKLVRCKLIYRSMIDAALSEEGE